MPADVVHGNDGLHQDVFSDDVVLAETAIVDPAVGLLAGEREVFADRHLAHVERGVDANRPTLELVERPRTVLLEVVEGNVVRVVRAAA